MDSAFKDMLRDDIGSVFLNPMEFGEPHSLDGVKYNMIVDYEQLEDWNAARIGGGRGMQLPDADLEKGSVYIFIGADLFPEPEIGQVIRYDRKIYRALWTMEDDGMRHIVLGGYGE